MVKETQGQIPKTGTHEWLKEYSYHSWQIIRRHSDYISFCEMCGADAFDEDYPQELDPTRLEQTSLRQETQRIKKRFGLDAIYHYSVNISQKVILNIPLFIEPWAVIYERREETPNEYTPIWDDHYIKLKIDIREFRPKGQIQREVWDLVGLARDIAGIEGEKRKLWPPKEEIYKVWDLYKKDMSSENIIREIWPKEYEREWERESDIDKNKRFDELMEQYKSQGVKDPFEIVCKKVYEFDEEQDEEESASGRIRLLMRVNYDIKRMKKLFRLF